ncbi:MAG: chromosome segregation protein SMC, partial [Actinomycetota bacterium]
MVNDAKSAVAAITFLKSESAGSAEILFIEGAPSLATNFPSEVRPLAEQVTSSSLSQVIPYLLDGFVCASDLSEAERIVRNHPGLIAVTREGDLVGKGRASGGSMTNSSLIEITAMIEKSESELNRITHECERFQFEFASQESEVSRRQQDYDLALAKLNESDARMAGLTEQMAAASQSVRSIT